MTKRTGNVCYSNVHALLMGKGYALLWTLMKRFRQTLRSRESGPPSKLPRQVLSCDFGGSISCRGLRRRGFLLITGLSVLSTMGPSIWAIVFTVDECPFQKA